MAGKSVAPAGAGEAFALFEDRLGLGRSYLFRGDCDTFLCQSPNDLPAFFAAVAHASSVGQWVIVAADYEAGLWLESRFKDVKPSGSMRAWFFPAPVALDRDEADAFVSESVATLPDADRVAGVAEVQEEVDAAGYEEAVERIRAYIAAGDCYQVNFTYGLTFRSYGDPLALYERLRCSQPVRHGGFIRLPGLTALSLSPELFLSRRAGHLAARPMKGTARRSPDPEEDAVHARELAACAKNRAENIMIVDLIRNDLGRLAIPGTVRVDGLCRVEAYPRIFQMVSDVSAEVGNASLEAVFHALFPCGSITGAPKVRAMEIIRDLEAGPRGLYTGSLGWVEPSGDFDLNVAIRTLVLDGEGRGRMGVGSGIVADSRAPAERAECVDKAGFLLDLRPEFRLIETLRLEPGSAHPFPLLEEHLARLARSAAALGFRLEEAAVRSRLRKLAMEAPSGTVRRVRLLLAASGELELDSQPLAPLERDRLLLGLSSHRLRSSDYLLRHKTTVRETYDRELAQLPGEVFDLVHLNERDEVCEGARSSIFARLDGVLCTPPLSSGLLDGVMRRKLLADGLAVERVLRLDDLIRAESLYLANALRGLVPAVLVA